MTLLITFCVFDFIVWIVCWVCCWLVVGVVVVWIVSALGDASHLKDFTELVDSTLPFMITLNSFVFSWRGVSAGNKLKCSPLGFVVIWFINDEVTAPIFGIEAIILFTENLPIGPKTSTTSSETLPRIVKVA